MLSGLGGCAGRGGGASYLDDRLGSEEGFPEAFCEGCLGGGGGGGGGPP